MTTFKEYQHKSALIEQVIDNLPSAIIILASNTDIVLANKTAEMFAGKTRIHLFGLRGGDAFGCVHADENPAGCGYSDSCRESVVRNTVEMTIRTKKDVANIEAPMTFHDSGDRILSVATTWLDESKLVIVSLTDITEMKQQEKQQIELARLQAAVKTGGAVCHEMNQPLSVINGFIDLLRMGVDNPDEMNEYMAEIKEQAVRLGNLTRKLMNISRFRVTGYLQDTILDIDESSYLS